MPRMVWILILILILIVFVWMLPMHMRTGRFYWVPPKHAGETRVEQVHREVHQRMSLPSLKEGFESLPALKEESPLMEFAPDTPAPVEREDHPFHLLSDWFPSAKSEVANAAACYHGDYEQHHNCVKNFRQTTNNYKRDYPDSCSGTPQDFVMGFYGRA
jgi:hypothetical protein